MYQNEGLKRLNNSLTYDRGVRLKHSLFLISHSHLPFLISHRTFLKKRFFY